jgi:hypothetical protein
MMKTIWREKVSFFIIGALSTAVIFLLIGATNNYPFGRYQMESIVRNNTVQIYAMDTTTGVIKWVDDMNIPFTQMKGE